MSVLLGAGDGTFAPAPAGPYPAANPDDVELADIDSDGSLDAIVHGTLVAFGDGAGGFAAHRAVLAGGDGAVADLDGRRRRTDVASRHARSSTCSSTASTGPATTT